MLRLARRTLATLFNTAAEAVADIPSGSTIAVGGFGNLGVPENLLQALSARGISDLKIIANNCPVNGYGLDEMLTKRQVSKFVGSYVGVNKHLEEQYREGFIELDFTPQGTLAEQLRAGGAGIPAFYTSTGYGTIVSEGNFPFKYTHGGHGIDVYSPAKDIRIFKGEHYVLEEAITTEYSLVKAWKADKLGNCIFRGSSCNFNPLAAKAGKISIVECEHLVEPGELDPNSIHLPAVYVKRLIHGPSYKKPIDHLMFDNGQAVTIPGKTAELRTKRERIARRAAMELQDKMCVNLGIGMPTLIPNFVNPNINILIHSENGILGMGGYPKPGQEDSDYLNAGEETVTVVKGASVFDSAESFAMIRGKHLDLSVLGGLEVSQEGDLANWIIPEKLVKGMGGAMDLVIGAKKLVIAMEHHNAGKPKLVSRCDLPLTGKKVVDTLITDMGVFTFDGTLPTLTEIWPEFSVEQIQAVTGCKFRVADGLIPMQQAKFR
jgi:3-oxoacid CoA-transferase